MATTDVLDDLLNSNPSGPGGNKEDALEFQEDVCRIENLLRQISQDLAQILEKLP